MGCKLLFSGVTHEIVGGDVLGAPHEKRLILNGEMSFMTMDIRTVSIAVWMYGPPRTSAPTVGVFTPLNNNLTYYKSKKKDMPCLAIVLLFFIHPNLSEVRSVTLWNSHYKQFPQVV